MAIRNNVGDADHWFVGEDKLVEVTVLQADEVTPQDVSGWEFSWRLKRRETDLDADALVTKTSADGIVVTGVFNAAPALNTQRVVVAVADTDTDPLAPGLTYHELKRTTPGSETVLTFGTVHLLRGVHRA